MGGNCIGRFGYGPKLTSAEIVMGRNVQWPMRQMADSADPD